MRTSWWRSKGELDTDQTDFIKLPPYGRYSLTGPAGSGKTNLLLLRAQYIAGTGEKNVLVVTYTKALADFIRSGIRNSGLISPSQVKTFHSWATTHILETLGTRAVPKGAEFDDEARAAILELLGQANQKVITKKQYSAIFVDEAQDLSIAELDALLSLSDNVCICGDLRQGIYDRDGLSAIDKLNLTPHTLKRHFRIGQRIARVADRLIPPEDEGVSLEATANYNPKVQGESSAQMHACASRDEQFARMCDLIGIQLDAFKDDDIGVFCGTKDTLSELADRFAGSKYRDLVSVHGMDADASFNSQKPIHVMTIHSAKGTEFRAVHLFGTEDLRNFPLNRRRLAYTAVTRAKTALNAYRTGETSKVLENAFAEPQHVEIDDLFGGDDK